MKHGGVTGLLTECACIYWMVRAAPSNLPVRVALMDIGLTCSCLHTSKGVSLTRIRRRQCEPRGAVVRHTLARSDSFEEGVVLFVGLHLRLHRVLMSTMGSRVDEQIRVHRHLSILLHHFLYISPRCSFRWSKLYNGQLQDGSRVLVRCLRLKPKYSPQSLSQYMEIISKFRHRHLVSIIGHCIVNDQENPTIASSVYLISECVTNGSLRSHLTEWRKREMLKWPQRVSATIGIARGIQFLHNVTAPDVVQNDINIENILLDKTLTSKISDFSLPMISISKNGKIFSENPFIVQEENDHGSAQPTEKGDKDDIYQFGLILLEVITGKSTESRRDLESLKAQLSEALAEDPELLKDMADLTIRGTFAVDSLSKVTEIALNCTATDPSDRPSIDDVLWNLQYSMQVQDGWASSESLSLSVKSQS